MSKCVVFYENWQMECCGQEFQIGSQIKWLVVDGKKIKLPTKTPKIDYYYEAHSSDYKNIFVLKGKVKEIQALYQKYEPKENSKLLIPTAGILKNINSSKARSETIEDKSFSAYLVFIEDFSIRPALQSEVIYK